MWGQTHPESLSYVRNRGDKAAEATNEYLHLFLCQVHIDSYTKYCLVVGYVGIYREVLELNTEKILTYHSLKQILNWEEEAGKKHYFLNKGGVVLS